MVSHHGFKLYFLMTYGKCKMKLVFNVLIRKNAAIKQ